MKKLFSMILALSLVLVLVACGGGQSETPAEPETPAETPAETAPADDAEAAPADDEVDPEPATAEAGTFEGKIAVVTNTVSQNEEEYRSAQQLVAKYGEEKVQHVTWPDNFMTEQEQMISIIAKIAADPEVKALILNQAVPGSNAAVDKLLETRDDMFIVYCTPQENPVDVVKRANLVVMPDEFMMGYTMVEQANNMGAKTFIHYSFPRHMSQVLLSGRREIIKAECEKYGIEFVDATAPDPTSDAGNTGAQQFILEDVPKMVAEYGEDTAFFSTNCVMQVPLIKAVVDEGAMYPQPCCPSPYHGFPSALGIDSGDIEEVIENTRQVIADAGSAGRLSNWPFPASMMGTNAGAEYAIKWMNGEVPAEGIDLEVLNQLMNDYAGFGITLNAYEEDDVEYPTFQMVLLDTKDYLVY